MPPLIKRCIITLDQGKGKLCMKFQSLKGSFKAGVSELEKRVLLWTSETSPPRQHQRGFHTDMLEILPKPAQHKTQVNSK